MKRLHVHNAILWLATVITINCSWILRTMTASKCFINILPRLSYFLALIIYQIWKHVISSFLLIRNHMSSSMIKYDFECKVAIGLPSLCFGIKWCIHKLGVLKVHFFILFRILRKILASLGSMLFYSKNPIKASNFWVFIAPLDSKIYL